MDCGHGYPPGSTRPALPVGGCRPPREETCDGCVLHGWCCASLPAPVCGLGLAWGPSALRRPFNHRWSLSFRRLCVTFSRCLHECFIQLCWPPHTKHRLAHSRPGLPGPFRLGSLCWILLYSEVDTPFPLPCWSHCGTRKLSPSKKPLPAPGLPSCEVAWPLPEGLCSHQL